MPRPTGERRLTLTEIMLAAAILTILAAMIIPRLVQHLDRDREAGTPGNMSTLQLMEEDTAVQNNGATPAVMEGGPPADRPPPALAAHPGIVSYADSDSVVYEVQGRGRSEAIHNVLVSGR